MLPVVDEPRNQKQKQLPGHTVIDNNSPNKASVIALFPEGIPPLGKTVRTVIQFPESSQFTGLISSPAMDGLGRFTFSSESTYYGFVKNSISHGPFGLMKMQQGMTYVGSFKDGELCGRVLIVFSDGSTFRGDFANNKASGYGAIHLTSTNVDFAGSFIDSTPNGFGTVGTGSWRGYIGTGEKGPCSIYIGDFCEGEPDGVGMSIVAADNEVMGARRFNRFFGSFYGGMRSGSGVLYTSNNDMLIGTFVADKKTGLFMHIEGTSKQCEFRLYDSDVCLDTYLVRGVYFRNPWMLMNIVLDLHAMCPNFTDMRAAFTDFLYELESCLLSGLEPVANGRNNYKKSIKYPIIDIILAQSTRQTVPCSTKLITDCRISYPWIVDTLAKHVRYSTGEGMSVHYATYLETEKDKVGAGTKQSSSMGTRSPTPTSRASGNSIALSRTTSRLGDRAASSLSNQRLSVQQSAFMDKIDTLKSTLLSCYDMLRFIFCIYRAQEILLLDEHTKSFSDQQVIFSIDVPSIVQPLQGEIMNSSNPKHNPTWKIRAYTLFTPSYCKALLADVPNEYKRQLEVPPSTNITVPVPDKENRNESVGDYDAPSIDVLKTSEGHAKSFIDSPSSQQKDYTEKSFVVGGHLSQQFSVGENYTADALLSDIVSLDSSRSAQTVAGTTSYDNELVLAVMKMVEANDAISIFTIERMLLEIFSSQSTLATYFLANYTEIKRILNSICKPSDEYLMARTLGIDTKKYVCKQKDIDFEGFVEIIISLATLLGTQVMARVRADVLSSPSSLYNIHAGHKQAGQMQTSAVNGINFPLDDLLKFIIVPFGNMLLKQLTNITQASEKTQNVLEPLFAFLKKEGQTSKQCLKATLVKICTQDGIPVTGGVDLETSDAAQLSGLITTARASSVNLMASQSNLGRSKLQPNLTTSIRRTATPIAKLRDPSRSRNQFESALLGSLALVSRLTELFRLEPQTLAQLYNGSFYVFEPRLWSTVVSNVTILYRYLQIFSDLDTSMTEDIKHATKPNLFDVFKHIKTIFNTIFIRKLEHSIEGVEDSEDEELLFSEQSSEIENSAGRNEASDHQQDELASQKDNQEIQDNSEVNNGIIVIKPAQYLLAQLSSYNIYTRPEKSKMESSRTIRFDAPSSTGETKGSHDNVTDFSAESSLIYQYNGTDDDIYEIAMRLMAFDVTPLLYILAVVSHCYCSDACFERLIKRNQEDSGAGSFNLPSTADSSTLTNSMLVADMTLRDEIYAPLSCKFFADETVRCLFECSTRALDFLRQIEPNER